MKAGHGTDHLVHRRCECSEEGALGDCLSSCTTVEIGRAARERIALIYHPRPSRPLPGAAMLGLHVTHPGSRMRHEERRRHQFQAQRLPAAASSLCGDTSPDGEVQRRTRPSARHGCEQGGHTAQIGTARH
jgi:hypothetical protein